MKNIILVREDPRPHFHEQPTYNTCHRRVYRVKGKASLHQCVDCTAQAHEWSYTGGSPDELWGLASSRAAQPSRYSPDPDYYEPRCRRCHKAHDMKAAA